MSGIVQTKVTDVAKTAFRLLPHLIFTRRTKKHRHILNNAAVFWFYKIVQFAVKTF